MHEVHSLTGDVPVLPAPEADPAALLASRICHDLFSPLGAIANGVELLALAGIERTPEMDLIAESVQGANARLRFFRLAYGVAGRRPIGRAEVVRTLAELSRTGRLAYDWSAEGDPPRDEVKAVLLLLQCLEAAMPMGGRLRVTRSDGLWEVTAEAPRLRTDLPAWDALRAPSALPAEASLVQFWLLPQVLAGLGRHLSLSLDPDRILARF